MTRRFALAVVLLVTLAPPTAAFDPAATFKEGTVVVSGEGSFGAQFNLESHRDQSDIEFWNTGVRVSLLPFGTSGRGFWFGALEIGLEPFYQSYTEPHHAFFGGLGAVGRYHFLGLGRLVPYAELFAGAGGTDLRVKEIQSDFNFLLQGGLGVSFFVTDTAAVYAGYRLQHVSNGNTEAPNRGFESHTGVFGVSLFFE